MADENIPSILIAFNLEDPEPYALELGLHTARQWKDAHVHIVYVVTTAHLYAYEGQSILAQQESALESAPEKLKARVMEVVGKMFGDEPKPKVTVHVRVGQAAKVTLQTAVDYSADMIVVGTHDRRGLEKLLLGSIAQEIAREARCAVLIARPTNYAGLEKTPAIEPGGETPGSPEGRKVRVYSYSHNLSWSSPSPLRG